MIRLRQRLVLWSCTAALLMGSLTGTAAVVSAPATPGSATAQAPSPEFSFTDPLFEPVGDSDTVPLGVVTALAHDAQGMQWIGTQLGLVRHDGYRFRRFVHEAQDANSLAGNYVKCLWPTTDGRLWVGTASGGLSVYDPATERFRSFSHDHGQSGSINPGTTVWALTGNAAGDLWIGTDQGLDFLPHGGTQFRHYRHDPADATSLADDRVRSLFVDRHGVLWVGSTDGLQRLRPDGNGFDRLASEVGQADSLAGQTIFTMFEATDGKLWLGTASQGAAWLDPVTLQLQHPVADPTRADRLSHPRVYAIAQPQAGQIWLGTQGGGINVVSADDGRVLQQLRHDAAIGSSLAFDGIGALALDRAGLLTVGTWGGGLQRLNPRNPVFRLLRHSHVRVSGLSHADVRSVLELANGQLLAGTGGNGIDIFNRQSGRVGGYPPGPGRAGVLADGFIQGMARTADGALWAGTRNAGMQRLAAGATDWQTYSLAEGLPSAFVFKVFVDRTGELWIGTAEGLAHWQAERQRFETFSGPDGKPMRELVNALIDDAQGRLWISSDAGLWLREPGATLLRRIRHDPQQAASLSSDDVAGLLEDHSGRIWVDTRQGLERLQSWDGKTARFEHISTRLGRPGLYFGGNLLEDKLGRIWTQWHVFDPKGMKLHTLSKADGLDIGTAWIGSFGKTHDGLFLFGGTQGLAIVEPEKFQPWDYAPPLVATELRINGQPVPTGVISPQLTLRPEQRSFALEFAALDLSAPQKNRYRYRLQGYDTDWIATDAANRVAAYGNLAPGDYTLRVSGSNRLGDWSPQELSIPVRVLPAWYQTLWFRLLLALLALSSMYGVVLWRTAVLRQRQRELEGVVGERTAELQKKNKELERLSVTDRLTGLFNRLRLDRVLDDELRRSQRYSSSFALVLLDIDHFKSVNDTYGHPVGDQVLMDVARLLGEGTRELDVVGRWGGEEFLIICPGTTLEGAMAMAEKLRAGVAGRAFAVAGNKTASFGVTAVRSNDNVSAMIARADAALYRSKTNGRNRVEGDA